MVDVISKRCEHPDCTVRPSYGRPGHAASMCVAHKIPGMMAKSKKRCETTNCSAWSTYGITAPVRCEEHKWPRDQNLVEEQCVSCALVYILDDKGFCESCNPNTAKRARLAKQREVEQYLHVQMPEYPPTSVDRIPPGLHGCGDRERPDTLWERQDRVVILEVDEHQHQERNCACEQTRMINISQKIGMERTLWIRYNPDKFDGESRTCLHHQT